MEYWVFLLFFLPNSNAKPFIALPYYLSKHEKQLLYRKDYIGKKEALLGTGNDNADPSQCCTCCRLFWLRIWNEHPFVGLIFSIQGTNYTSKQRALALLVYGSTVIWVCAYYFAEQSDPNVDELWFALIACLCGYLPMFLVKNLFIKTRPKTFVYEAKKLAEFEALRLNELEKVINKKLTGYENLEFTTIMEYESDFENETSAPEEKVDYFTYVDEKLEKKLIRAQMLAGEESLSGEEQESDHDDDETLTEQLENNNTNNNTNNNNNMTNKPPLRVPITLLTVDIDVELSPPKSMSTIWNHYRERIFLLNEIYPLPHGCSMFIWLCGLSWSIYCFINVIYLSMEWYESS
eukprot:UN32233